MLNLGSESIATPRFMTGFVILHATLTTFLKIKKRNNKKNVDVNKQGMPIVEIRRRTSAAPSESL